MAVVIGENAYITEQEFIDWAESRGYTVDAAKLSGNIVSASLDFIDVYYCFAGKPLSADQPMKLPTDKVSIANIKSAACFAVHLQQQGLLQVNLSTATQGAVTSESKSLGTMSKSTSYAEVSKSYTNDKRPTPQIDRLLKPFLCADFGVTQLVRV